MTTIVTRAGKGAPLTNVEVDANFTNLNNDKLEKTSNLSDLANAATARTNLGLGNVNNTSDANKPISLATQTALNAKQNAATAVAKDSNTGAAAIPSGTTAQRPASPAAGHLRYNITSNVFEGYGSSGWGTLALGSANNIGTPGAAGFGVGICPDPATAGMVGMTGYADPTSDNYGNYQFADGSIMVWIPAFYYKYGTGSNGLALNAVDVKAVSAYADVATANAAGYAMHRAFYDGGLRDGFFIDKYLCSNNGGIFSSIKNGIPCDTDGSQSGVAAITGVDTNNYGMVQQAAKSRGANFHSASIFMHKALALLSYAHAQAATGTAYCAWFDATYNFPKGCNNNALGDVNDGALTFVTAGHPSYPAKPKTGSANALAKTAHNGQNSGVVDLNGAMWEVAYGLTSNGSNYYALKTSKRLRDLTGSDATSTNSFFGANGIAINYDHLGVTIGQATASSSYKTFGSTAQGLSEATGGANWQATGAGIPINAGGTNAFGADGFWDYRPNELCPIVGAAWDTGSAAGVWALHLANVRASARGYVGGRAALYL